jgi:hypothetical protein
LISTFWVELLSLQDENEGTLNLGLIKKQHRLREGSITLKYQKKRILQNIIYFI